MTNSNEKTFALFSNPANKKIIAELEKSGARVFQFPPLETEKLNSDETSADLKNLGFFDWVIFPDVLTVDYFLQILLENEIDLFEMDALRVCAFGETVADHLRFVQLHADVIPLSVETNDVFGALSDYIGKDEMSGLKFILPKEIKSEYKVKDKLTENGSSVYEVAVYRTKISHTGEVAKLKALIRGGAIDEFIFSSSTDLIALKSFFGDDLTLLSLPEINFSASNEVILQMLRENNFSATHLRFKQKRG